MQNKSYLFWATIKFDDVDLWLTRESRIVEFVRATYQTTITKPFENAISKRKLVLATSNLQFSILNERKSFGFNNSIVCSLARHLSLALIDFPTIDDLEFPHSSIRNSTLLKDERRRNYVCYYLRSNPAIEQNWTIVDLVGSQFEKRGKYIKLLPYPFPNNSARHPISQLVIIFDKCW